MVPTKRDARIAGLLYLLFAAPGPFCLLYVPDRIIVSGDAAATAANVLAHEMLLRTSVVIWLLGLALWIVMALALYRLFHGVSKALASLLVIFVAVSAGIGFLNELNNLAAILVLRGNEFSGPLTQPQREAMAMLFLRLHGQGHAVNEMFWGLWLLPLGYLAYKSGLFPKVLGVVLIVGGACYIVDMLAAFLVPDVGKAIHGYVTIPSAIAEVSMVLYLLVIGVKTATPGERLVPKEGRS